MVKQFEKLDSTDSAQLAKHRGGQYGWVVSLPAKSKSADEGTTREPSSTQDKKVHFGCTLVRADGNSELVRRNRSDSGNTYTLIATPIETPMEEDGRPSTGHMEPMFEKAVKTAIPAITEADDVKSLHGMIEEAKSLIGSHQHNVSPASGYAAQSWDGVAEAESAPSSTRAEHGENPKMQPSAPADRISEQAPSVKGGDGDRRERHASLDLRYWDDQKGDCSNECTSPSSRIEDSLEALDEFEERLEAISEATQLDRVLSPGTIMRPGPRLVVAEKPTTRRPTTNVTKPTSRRPTSSPPRGRPTERKASGRKVAATRSPPVLAPGRGQEKKHAKPTTAPKRLSVTKPASLQPPKPLARTVKPPTVATFELPGDAVARRLKAKREARLSLSTPNQVSRVGSTSPAKAKTVGKPATRPNFELPGEAISRRKREELEAKLKAQEEEERKRREFKARPVRTSISSGTLSYRETAASRARKSVIQNHNETRTPPANKRQSMAATIHGRPSLSRPALDLDTGPKISSASKASTVRGRRSMVVSDRDFFSHGSSPSSAVGVSAQERQAQKARGRAIYERDNKTAADTGRQRASQDAVWRAAREQAVERAKQASLKWKDKLMVPHETLSPELV